MKRPISGIFGMYKNVRMNPFKVVNFDSVSHHRCSRVLSTPSIIKLFGNAAFFAVAPHSPGFASRYPAGNIPHIFVLAILALFFF